MRDTSRDSNYMVISRKLGVGEGKEKGQGRDRMGNQDCRLTRTHSPWQAQLRLSYKLQFKSRDIGFYPTTLSLSIDDTNKIKLLHDLLQKGYREQYALVNSKVLVTRTVLLSREVSDNKFQEDFLQYIDVENV